MEKKINTKAPGLKNESMGAEKNNHQRRLKNQAPDGQYLKNLLISVLVAGFLSGALAGILFSAWVSTDSEVAGWIGENIFGRTKSYSTVEEMPATTLTVKEESATIEAVKKVSPAVVSIVVTQDLKEIYGSNGGRFYPFSDLFELEGEQEVGAGTGFIVSGDGMIVTNKHVVSTEKAEYTVIMNDGQQYQAEIVDMDPFNDIALIKINGENFPVAEIGDSDSLEIGQTVIAIGNTLGEYQNTVTKGVISGLSRTVVAGDGSGQSETLEDIIQTDAAINFGNSGGPLINLAGQVIGLNTAISRSGQLVGFAIPINQAKRDIDSVLEFGKIIRPYLGVRYMIINEEIAAANNLSVDYGALIVRGSQSSDLAVVPGSAADKAGLEENDIILEVDGQRIDQQHSLARQLQNYYPGDTITLKILHDGEEKTIQTTLEEAGD